MRNRITTEHFLVALIVPLVALAILASCNKNPAGPDPPTGPKDGQITIVYQPQTPCRSEGTEFAERCDRRFHPVSIAGLSWPDGYKLQAQMILNADGTLIATAIAPSSVWAGRLRVQVGDPWLCPLQSVCGSEIVTGKGITINGVRLSDGLTETNFSFTPPDTVVR